MSTKSVNLFTSNLTGKALVTEKSETRKATAAALADYSKSLDAEFTKVIKSEDRRARNLANAVKGRYQTVIAAIAACYPYQTAAGVLACKKTREDGEKVWAEKKLTASAARGIVRDSLNNFTKTVGQPVVTVVVVGQPVAND